MKRYAALLRGVTPMNCAMPALARAFERGGFADVKTVLGTGNVVFGAEATPIGALERRVEAAIAKHLGRHFPTIVRPVDALRRLVASDPFAAMRLAPGSKRVVTFLRARPKADLELPIELHGARILARRGSEVFSAYERTPKGPVFMVLIERTYGKDVTTRTWETVEKVVRAGVAPAR